MVLGISKLLGGGLTEIIEKIFEKAGTWIGAMLSIIPKTLYLAVTFLMQIVDIIQILFQKLAGLDVYYIEGSSEAQSGDFLTYFLRKVLFEKGTLNTAFWSIVIVGLFLLVFATIVAVIRTQYNYDEKPVSPTKIVGKAIKSLISFAIVPIVAFFGVYLGNIFLNALNSATSSQIPNIEFDESAKIKLKPYELDNGKKTYAGINLFGTNLAMRQDTFSGMIFRAATYRANRIRNDADFRAICDGTHEESEGSIYSGVTFGMFEVNSSDYEKAATLLDDAFVYNYRLDQSAYVNVGAFDKVAVGNVVGVLIGDYTVALYAIPYQTFSRYNVSWVWFYYDLWQFDYIMAIIAIVACAVIYLNITSAMMKRAIELTMLMVVSPAVVAVTPLDGGAMQKRWRESFIKKTLSAYGAVVGVNLLFIILPVIRNVNFFNIAIVDTIVQMLFTIVGLTCVKDFMKMMSELVGGEDANSVGGDINKKIADTAMKVGSVAAGVAMPAAGALKGMMGKSIGGLAGKGAAKLPGAISDRNIQNKAKNEVMGELMDEGYSKSQAKEMIKTDTSVQRRIDRRADFMTADRDAKKGQKKYSRFTSNLEQRERNKYIRDEMKKDKKSGMHYSDAHYEEKADEYMATDAAKQAVAKREQHRKSLGNISAPLKFMGAVAGQVVDETYGDKVYGGFKNVKNAYGGKSVSGFGSAAAKDKKENKEKEDAKIQQESDRRLAEQQLTATQQTNNLLNSLLSKLDK